MEHNHHHSFYSGGLVALLGVAIGVSTVLATTHLTAGVGADPNSVQKGVQRVGTTDYIRRHDIRRRGNVREHQALPAHRQITLDAEDMAEALRLHRAAQNVETSPNTINDDTSPEHCREYEHPVRGYCEALARQGIKFLTTEERKVIEDSVSEKNQTQRRKTGDDLFYEWNGTKRVLKKWNGPTTIIRPDREVPDLGEENVGEGAE